MIDSTISRAHVCSSGYGKNSQDREGLGRSKGGFTTKIHLLTDALGRPLKSIITPGQRQDITQAMALVQGLQGVAVIADRGYDANELIKHLIANCCEVVIPPKKNRKELRFYDKTLYKTRHLIECAFGKMKQFRRVAMRYDKSVSAFLGTVNFVSVFMWLRGKNLVHRA